MNLRVFSNPEGKLLVEISHPLLASRKMWVLSMLSESDKGLKQSDDDFLSVRFNDTVYRIPFLSIRTLDPRPARHLVEIGRLEENHSRDLLNNVRDLLAWD